MFRREYKLEGKESAEMKDLPPFVQGYIEAAFFMGEETEEYNISEMSFHDIPRDELVKIIEDCQKFYSENEGLLSKLSEADPEYGDMEAGRDLYYTRNGHGVGFWDRGFKGEYAEIAEELSDKASAMGTSELSLADDGSLFTM